MHFSCLHLAVFALLLPGALTYSRQYGERPSPSAANSLTRPLPSSSPPYVFHPEQFGAVADDGSDDTAALQATIDAAIRAGPYSTVQLAAGQYDISDALHIHNAVYFTLAGVSPSSTLLLVHAVSAVLDFGDCQHLTFSFFSIDFTADFLPFTAGYITNVSSAAPFTFDVKIVPPHPVQANMTSAAIFVYDVTNGRPASGPDTYEIFQTVDPATRGSSIVADGVVRFALERRSELSVGQPVVVRYDGGPHAISGGDSYDVTLQSMVVYTSWDMSHASNRIHGLRVVDYHVMRAEGRWLSTWADCMHFGDFRPLADRPWAIAIVDSSCEGMGDDGLNVHAYFYNTTQLINSTTLVISLLDGRGWLDTLNVGVGTSMTFSRAATPYLPYAQYKIAALAQYSSSSYVYTFTTPILDVALYDFAYVSNSPSVLLSNFTVHNNRARGVLLETHNVTIERSLFQHTSGPAILFQPSMYWGEAEEGANVTVRETVFDSCNQGIAQQEGVIAILPDPIQTMGVIRDITVERSTFLQGQYSLALLQSYNGAAVTLQDNWIGNVSGITAPVLICNSDGLLVQHNRAWNGSRAPYGLDSGGVCDDSLSTGLDFTADAFNATFTPYVLPAPSGYGVIVVSSDTSAGGTLSVTMPL